MRSVPLKTILAYLVLALCAFAQTATITWADGTDTTVPLLSGGGEALENRYRNTYMSDRWGNHKGTAGPVFVQRITVKALGYTILDGQDFYGYVDLGGGRWQICGPNQYKYPARRGGIIPGYEKCTQYHTFDGGDLIGYVRLVPEDDPIEQRFLAEVITQESVDLCAKILTVDEKLVSKWPWLAKFATRWTWTPASWSSSTPADKRDFGWYLRPENFMARYPGQPGGLPLIKHFMGFGTRAPGGSCVNEHEGHIAWYLAQAQRDNDLPALHKALALARAKAAYGVIVSSPADDLYGMTRNEGGDKLRGTSGMGPSTAKMWMEGIIALDALLQHKDPLLAEVVQVNGDVLKSQRYSACYHGGGGTRMLSHLLMNLRAHYVASGDEGFKAKAVSEITKAFTHPVWGVGANNYWGSAAVASLTNTMCYDEGLPAIVAWWCDQSPSLQQFVPKLKAIVAHTLAHVVRSDGRVGYKWNPTTMQGTSLSEIAKGPDGKPRTLAPLEVVYNGHFNGCWMLALRPWCEREFPGVYTATFDKIEQYAFTRYASATANGWQTFDGAEGVSFEKMAGFIMSGTQNWWLN